MARDDRRQRLARNPFENCADHVDAERIAPGPAGRESQWRLRQTAQVLGKVEAGPIEPVGDAEALVSKLMGPSTMLATARFLLIEPPGREQRPYAWFIPRFDHGDAAILRAQHHLHATGAKTYRLGDLTTTAGLEQRTFLRRFSKATGFKPTEYVQQIRIAKAREQLETTNQPIEQVAWEVGYGDPASFRKTFQKVTGMGPSAYRDRFGVA